MGTIRNGGNGAFSGKAGSFIGSSWRDISYIKGLPKISNKPKTLKQLDQQVRFATAVKFLQVTGNRKLRVPRTSSPSSSPKGAASLTPVSSINGTAPG